MPGERQILVLAALEAEMALLRPHLEGRTGLRLVVTGMGPARAAAAARLHAPASRLIISTGCCGGLRAAPFITDAAGLLVIPRRVLDEKGEAPAPHFEWVEAALAAARRLDLSIDEGPLVTVTSPLLEPAAKRAQAERSGASAVDMETAAIAAVAAELGVPYLAIRVVLDCVEEALPGSESERAHVSMTELRERLRVVGEGLARCVAKVLADV